ncbi:MAG TPA: hypothetical protein VF507_01740 [Pyrinomonadaceae bacterium]|jgi:hypothetical protein
MRTEATLDGAALADAGVGHAGAPAARNVTPAFSDPNASRMNIRLTTIILVLIAMLFGSLAANFVQWFSGPALAVAKETPQGGIQVVSYNGKPVQSEDGSVRVRPDVIQDGDKTYYAGEYARLLYAMNPMTRGADVERALRMMVSSSAKVLMSCLGRGCDEYDLNLDRQRAESWQAVWTEQKNEVDAHDPYTVNIIGLQQLTKVVNNTVQKETKQISLSIKLVADPLGRQPRNLRNGVLVDSYQYKVISTSAQ